MAAAGPETRPVAPRRIREREFSVDCPLRRAASGLRIQELDSAARGDVDENGRPRPKRPKAPTFAASIFLVARRRAGVVSGRCFRIGHCGPHPSRRLLAQAPWEEEFKAALMLQDQTCISTFTGKTLQELPGPLRPGPALP